jgi:NAD+ synthase (glutamine-hydrolysing)
LCSALNIELREIGIDAAVAQHLSDINHNGSPDVTFENAQARERTQILMDLANMEGGIVVGTGDLSELALGWCTYNADHMSMYGVNAGVPKTLVRHIIDVVAATHANLESVLRSILDTPVSPELLPPGANGVIEQRTEDILGPYEVHDFFLYHTIRLKQPVATILALATAAFSGVYTPRELVTWYKTFVVRFFSQQFKRSAMPDSVKVGTVAISPRADWRMPSDASAVMWLQEIDALMHQCGMDV